MCNRPNFSSSIDEIVVFLANSCVCTCTLRYHFAKFVNFTILALHESDNRSQGNAIRHYNQFTISSKKMKSFLLVIFSAISACAAWMPGLDLIGYPHRSIIATETETVLTTLLPIMNLDLAETESSFSVHADLPGVEKTDVEVNIENGVLSIKAEKKNKYEDTTSTVHHMERSYGMVQRSIRLPKNVEMTRIAATMENGVLQVTLPKNPTLMEYTDIKVPVK